MSDYLLELEKEVSPIFDTLLTPGSLWHRTSLEGFRSMVQSGFILPSGEAPNPKYPGASAVSVSKRMGAVSLFDFESGKRDLVLGQSRNWLQFMTDCGHPTLVLRFDKKSFLNEELFTQEELTRDNTWPMRPLEMFGETRAYYIPFVETWHRGKLAIEKTTDILVVSNHRSKNFELISYSLGLRKLNDEWPQSSIQLEPWSPAMLRSIAKVEHETN